uniref:FUS-interacting serine-arginine-rich protein 1 n=1 Tax=Tetraselmis sp. GSL018 TaxID=582737 RepID=A0A061S2F5_9CHLO|mmetsp:Transcript_19182/g.45757  ORF Transcript_19182/g.45757 Transcript_19182/m.45757 type:complete len:227 (-) Transcript_19182:241-921(-)
MRRERGVNCSLLIRNLSKYARTEDVRYAAEKYGAVRDVYLPLDYYTKQPRGIGFVEFYNPEDAQDCQHGMDGKIIEGLEVKVVFAERGRKRPEDYRSDRGRQPDRGYGRDREYERGYSRERDYGRARGSEYGYDRNVGRERSYERAGDRRRRSVSAGRGRSPSPRRSLSREPERIPPPRRERSPQRERSPRRDERMGREAYGRDSERDAYKNDTRRRQSSPRPSFD